MLRPDIRLRIGASSSYKFMTVSRQLLALRAWLRAGLAMSLGTLAVGLLLHSQNSLADEATSALIPPTPKLPIAQLGCEGWLNPSAVESPIRLDVDDKMLIEQVSDIDVRRGKTVEDFLDEYSDPNQFVRRRKTVQDALLEFFAQKEFLLEELSPETVKKLDLVNLLRLGLIINGLDVNSIAMIGKRCALSPAQISLLSVLSGQNILVKYGRRNLEDDVLIRALSGMSKGVDLTLIEFAQILRAFSLTANITRPERGKYISRTERGELRVNRPSFDALFDKIRKSSDANTLPEKKKDRLGFKFESAKERSEFLKYYAIFAKAFADLKGFKTFHGLQEVGELGVEIAKMEHVSTRASKIISDTGRDAAKVQAFVMSYTSRMLKLIRYLKKHYGAIVRPARLAGLTGILKVPQYEILFPESDGTYSVIALRAVDFFIDEVSKDLVLDHINITKVDSVHRIHLSSAVFSAKPVPGVDGLWAGSKSDASTFNRGMNLVREIRRTDGSQLLLLSSLDGNRLPDVNGIVFDKNGVPLRFFVDKSARGPTLEGLQWTLFGSVAAAKGMMTLFEENPQNILNQRDGLMKFQRAFAFAEILQIVSQPLPFQRYQEQNPDNDLRPYQIYLIASSINASGGALATSKNSVKPIKKKKIFKASHLELIDLLKDFGLSEPRPNTDEEIESLIVNQVRSRPNPDSLREFIRQAGAELRKKISESGDLEAIEEIEKLWYELVERRPEEARRAGQVYLTMRTRSVYRFREFLNSMRSTLKHLGLESKGYSPYRLSEHFVSASSPAAIDLIGAAKTVDELTGEFDVMTRQTRYHPSVAAEVRVAKLESQRGIPVAFARIKDGQIVGLETEDMGQKVYAIGWKGAIDFRKSEKMAIQGRYNDEPIQFYSIVLPKGFVSQYGHVERRFDNQTVSLRNLLSNGAHIPGKLFSINFETTTQEEGQAHLDIAGEILFDSGEVMPMLKYLRSYVFAVLKIDESGNILERKIFSPKLP